ncbi:MAG: hypothetical protein L6Q71_05045 [Planctomycetes bacterium]|nr:hypothetical protein [Planctomycetota bacterium]
MFQSFLVTGRCLTANGTSLARSPVFHIAELPARVSVQSMVFVRANNAPLDHPIDIQFQLAKFDLTDDGAEPRVYWAAKQRVELTSAEGIVNSRVFDMALPFVNIDHERQEVHQVLLPESGEYEIQAIVDGHLVGSTIITVQTRE